MNRLQSETSPYLLQHKTNPVDWYPWGPEAFQASKDLNKPILLSVGYSTCHWCHVMAHESFESEEIAQVMNKYFVNVKVDREERPTVDRMYMAYVQALTGRGGWPMTVFLTPELKPFFGGTYFPPKSGNGQPGFPDLVKFFGEKWNEDREEITKSSEEDFQKLRQFSSSSASSPTNSIDAIPPFSVPAKTFLILSKTFDWNHGGFGDAPKFPQPVIMNFLLSYYHATKVPSEVLARLEGNDGDKVSGFELERLAAKYGVRVEGVEAKELQARVLDGIKKRAVESEEALNMVDFTLRVECPFLLTWGANISVLTTTFQKIAAGGIRDHVGSGFHRYSVDKTWLVPHFEKMLYDQAQLLSNYADLAAITKDVFHEEVCRDIIKYVERDLKDSRNAFYSAEDADSKVAYGDGHAKEGAFAVWTAQELDTYLGSDSPLFKYHFGVNPGGNVMAQYDPHEELTNQNILMQRRTLNETAAKFESNVFAVKSTIQLCLERLWKVRETRPKPHLDDKIMVAWNGLMISSLAKTARILQDENKNIQKLATDAAAFIKQNMYNETTKRLTRVQGTKIEGYADDYAFLIDALIELYQTTHDQEWLKWAVDLQATMDELFWDSGEGGYYTGTEGGDGVLIRMKDEYDGAEPTPSSIAVKNLLRLDAILAKPEYKQKAVKTFESMLPTLEKAPRAVPQMVANWIAYQRGVTEVVVQGTLSEDMEYLWKTTFHPFATIVKVEEGGGGGGWLGEQNALIKSISESGSSVGGGRVFVCEDGACNAPVSDVEGLKRVLA
ncbi:UNVERIFIED_CONTAM: spermatogenesis-associated protein 20 [Siphonaria sp. JEL0065]|nr:spermatogenesis-associated protein 20 [Siphonaria sp. JEL0065]